MHLLILSALQMSRLPLFLVLSISLHLLAGFLLFGRDVEQVSASPLKAAAAPQVVQVMLAPQPAAVAKPAAVSERPLAQKQPRQPAVTKPVMAKVAAVKPQPKPPAETKHKPAANPLQPTNTSAVAALPTESTAQPLIVSNKAHPEIAEKASASQEVFSRHPAFRLPPQQPRYPAQARRRNQQGVVLLEVRLDAHGKQREITLLRSSGFSSLDSAALAAVAGWQFHPEIINGKGVPSRVEIPIEFALLASR